MPVSPSFPVAPGIDPQHSASHVTALLAIECAGPGAPRRAVLERDAAEHLVAALAADVGRRIDDAPMLDLVAVGALYDQAQVLRPGWPLHAALAEAPDRVQDAVDGGRVIALGALHGRLPAVTLEPDTRLYGSPMLVLPWLLAGSPARVAEAGRRLEHELLEHGLVDPALALALGKAFGIEVTHARHLTTLDLCALTCAQYTHADLGPVWQVIETALLSPERALTVHLAEGPDLHWRDGQAHLDSSDAQWIARLRAILGAHGIELRAV